MFVDSRSSICFMRLLAGFIQPKIFVLPRSLYLGHPQSPFFVPGHALESRRVVLSLCRVLIVFQIGNFAKILSSAVERIMILVINKRSLAGPYYFAVHPDLGSLSIEARG